MATIAASASLRASAADSSSPARSQPNATNADPDAMPPSQKYTGTSHVHTGALMIGPDTTAGDHPAPVHRRDAQSTLLRRAPVTTIPRSAFAFTFAFFATEATAMAIWPSAGTGTLTVAAWAGAAMEAAGA